MRVVLGTFVCTGIEAFLGRDIATGVQTALRDYTRREADRESQALPRFTEYSLGRSGAELDLAIDPEIEAALKRKAKESGGVPVEKVVTHAVLVHLADLDKASELSARPLTQV